MRCGLTFHAKQRADFAGGDLVDVDHLVTVHADKAWDLLTPPGTLATVLSGYMLSRQTYPPCSALATSATRLPRISNTNRNQRPARYLDALSCRRGVVNEITAPQGSLVRPAVSELPEAALFNLEGETNKRGVWVTWVQFDFGFAVAGVKSDVGHFLRAV